MRRRLVVLLVSLSAVLVVGYAGRTLDPVPRAGAAPLRLLCGIERWPVKIFADDDKDRVDLVPLFRTIPQLNKLVRPPKRPQNGRVAAELRTYRVTATVTANINEDDGDVHLVLRSPGGATMIAEAPEPACTVNARAGDAIKAARLVAQDVKVGQKVVAIGVGFFDFSHRQTGHADNYLELHPLLSLRVL